MPRNAPPWTGDDLRRRLLGHRSAQLLSTAVRLGLPEALEAGRTTPAELARAVGAEPSPLAEALESLVVEGVVERPRPGHYRLTPAGRRLLPGAPGGLADLAREVGEVDYATWGELLHRIRTDGSAFERAHGRSWFADRVTRDPRLFDRMAATARPIAEAVADLHDLDGLRLVDVGGGAGGFLFELLERLPGATGVVFDQEVLRPAAERALAASGLGGRCRFEGGSFFDRVPAGGDRYLLVRVLRNWGDAEAVALLSAVARAAGEPSDEEASGDARVDPPPSSRKAPRVLVVDPVPAGAPEPSPLALGGRRRLRTRAGLAALFEPAGLELVDVRPLPRWGHVVEAALRSRAVMK